MEDSGRVVSSPFHREPESWRLWSVLELGAMRAAPGLARDRTRKALREWDLIQFTDAAEMVVSELVSNSVMATHRCIAWPEPPQVRFWLLSDGARVLVMVWDAVQVAPVPREAGPDDETGRGLSIVAALSSEWSFYPAGFPAGKVTWSLITTP